LLLFVIAQSHVVLHHKILFHLMIAHTVHMGVFYSPCY